MAEGINSYEGLAANSIRPTNYVQSLGDRRLWNATVQNGGVVPSNVGNYLTQDQLLAAQTGDFGGYGKNLTRDALGQNVTGVNPGGDTGLFGLKDTTWSNIGTLGNLGMGLAGTVAAMEQLNLQKDAFKFNKDMKEKEYGMARDAYDRNVARAAGIGEQMRKGQVS